MSYEIITFGQEALRAKSTPVEAITPEILEIANEMLTTMHLAHGLGLAAEQVARTEAICMVDVPADAEYEEYVEFNAPITMPLILVNPKITTEIGSQRKQEGCLSFPEIYAQITRFEEVTCEYMDLEGQQQTITVRGLLARAIQHELDHLEGVLLVDRMSATQKLSVSGRLKRMRKKALKGL